MPRVWRGIAILDPMTGENIFDKEPAAHAPTLQQTLPAEPVQVYRAVPWYTSAELVVEQ